jgi:hypothetical protein
MVISASFTQLPDDVAQERIKFIIDSDPRIKREIEARMKKIDAKNSSAVNKLSAAPYLSQQERAAEIEKKKRELAIYDQYIADLIFRPKVDSALA